MTNPIPRVRIALTGAHSGPGLDKLIPLIEDDAALGLGIPSVRDRIERFGRVGES
jgi:hypothetical protein